MRKIKKEGGFKAKALRTVETKAGGIENSGQTHSTQSLKTLTLSPCPIPHHLQLLIRLIVEVSQLQIRSSAVVELAD